MGKEEQKKARKGKKIGKGKEKGVWESEKKRDKRNERKS